MLKFPVQRGSHPSWVSQDVLCSNILSQSCLSPETLFPLPQTICLTWMEQVKKTYLWLENGLRKGTQVPWPAGQVCTHGSLQSVLIQRADVAPWRDGPACRLFCFLIDLGDRQYCSWKNSGAIQLRKQKRTRMMEYWIHGHFSSESLGEKDWIELGVWYDIQERILRKYYPSHPRDNCYSWMGNILPCMIYTITKNACTIFCVKIYIYCVIHLISYSNLCFFHHIRILKNYSMWVHSF